MHVSASAYARDSLIETSVSPSGTLRSQLLLPRRTHNKILDPGAVEPVGRARVSCRVQRFLDRTFERESRDLAESIAEFLETAGGCDDILTQAAGIEAGAWYARPSIHAGY
jgi:hypothetical protein